MKDERNFKIEKRGLDLGFVPSLNSDVDVNYVGDDERKTLLGYALSHYNRRIYVSPTESGYIRSDAITELAQDPRTSTENINRDIADGRNAIHYAASYSTLIDALNIMLSKEGVNFDEPDKSGQTPLYLAAQEGKSDTAAALIRKGANVSAKDKDGHTPLYAASVSGSVEIFQALIKAGAKMEDSPNPLIPAIIAGNTHIIDTLLEAKVDVKTTDAEQKTALHHLAGYAAKQTHPVTLGAVAERMQKLINAGADINAVDKDGKTAFVMLPKAMRDHFSFLSTKSQTELNQDLEYGIAQNDLAIVKKAVGQGADVNSLNNTGDPLLLLAVTGRAKKLEIIRFLLDNGADANIAGMDGITPLHMAAEIGVDGIVLALLEAHANITAQNQNSMTALLYASASGNKDAATVLLDNGADIKDKDKEGKTPLHLAVENGHIEVAQLLIARGADPQALDANGKTPLELAPMDQKRDFSFLAPQPTLKITPPTNAFTQSTIPTTAPQPTVTATQTAVPQATTVRPVINPVAFNETLSIAGRINASHASISAYRQTLKQYNTDPTLQTLKSELQTLIQEQRLLLIRESGINTDSNKYLKEQIKATGEMITGRQKLIDQRSAEILGGRDIKQVTKDIEKREKQLAQAEKELSDRIKVLEKEVPRLEKNLQAAQDNNIKNQKDKLTRLHNAAKQELEQAKELQGFLKEMKELEKMLGKAAKSANHTQDMINNKNLYSDKDFDKQLDINRGLNSNGKQMMQQLEEKIKKAADDHPIKAIPVEHLKSKQQAISQLHDKQEAEIQNIGKGREKEQLAEKDGPGEAKKEATNIFSSLMQKFSDFKNKAEETTEKKSYTKELEEAKKEGAKVHKHTGSGRGDAGML